VVVLSSRELDLSPASEGNVEQMSGPPAEIAARMEASGRRIFMWTEGLRSITVSGWTMMIAFRSDGYSRYDQTNSRRSMFHSRTRFGDLRRSTTSCWRKMRFSVSSRARRANRDRIASSSWVRNATMAASLTHAHKLVIPDKVFGRHNRREANAMLLRLEKSAVTLIRPHPI
jgi:hypothetical protein